VLGAAGVRAELPGETLGAVVGLGGSGGCAEEILRTLGDARRAAGEGVPGRCRGGARCPVPVLSGRGAAGGALGPGMRRDAAGMHWDAAGMLLGC